MRYYILPNDIGLVIKLGRNKYIVEIVAEWLGHLLRDILEGYQRYYANRDDILSLYDLINRRPKQISRKALLTVSIPNIRMLAKRSEDYLHTLYELNCERKYGRRRPGRRRPGSLHLDLWDL